MSNTNYKIFSICIREMNNPKINLLLTEREINFVHEVFIKKKFTIITETQGEMGSKSSEYLNSKLKEICTKAVKDWAHSSISSVMASRDYSTRGIEHLDTDIVATRLLNANPEHYGTSMYPYNQISGNYMPISKQQYPLTPKECSINNISQNKTLLLL